MIKAEDFRRVPEEANNKYRQGADSLNEYMNSLNENVIKEIRDGRKTMEFINEQYEEARNRANDEYIQVGTLLNNEIRRQITEIKKTWITPIIKNHDDEPEYSARMNTALQLLQIEGKNLNDDSAANILHSFRRDFVAMQRFLKVIEVQLGTTLMDAYGKTTFVKTFSHMDLARAILEQINEIDKIAETIYIRPLHWDDDARPGRGAVALKLPRMRLGQMQEEHSLPELMSELEPLINKFYADDEDEEHDYRRFLEEDRYNPNTNGFPVKAAAGGVKEVTRTIVKEVEKEAKE